jgi:hypothetical protein
MAENLDNPSMGNFSIQDTMDMGMGNQELLSDLFAPETSTSNPDDIQDIKDEPAPAPNLLLLQVQKIVMMRIKKITKSLYRTFY